MTNKKFEEWIEPDNLTLLECWTREGLNDEEIADKIGITVRTLYRWQKAIVTDAEGKKTRPIKEALRKGKELPDMKVENALLQKALGGDTTAIIFWLKNRRPDKWRDKPVAKTDTAALEKLDAILKNTRDNASKEQYEYEPVKIIFDI